MAMKQLVLGLGLIALAGGAKLMMGSDSISADSTENVAQVSADNTDMNAAIAAAQDSLPLFLERRKHEGADWGMASVKVALQGETQIENIWVTNFVETGEDTWHGVLANEPVDLEGLGVWDPVTFETAQIVDWSFITDESAYGYYTTRVLIPEMSAEQAAAVRSLLADEPVPAHW